MAKDRQWIPAIDAVTIISAKLGDHAAKETLLSRMEDARLALAARLAIYEADLGEPYLSPDFWRSEKYFRSFPRQADRNFVLVGENDEDLIQLSKNTFARERSWSFDRDCLIWSQGIFFARSPARFKPPSQIKRKLIISGVPQKTPRSVEIPDDPQMRMVALDLHFSQDEVEAIMTPNPAGNNKGKARKFSHPDRTSNSRSKDDDLADDCRPYVKELERLVRSGEFEAKFGLPRRGLRAKIARDISKRMTDDKLYPPSDKTLERRAGEVLASYEEVRAKQQQ